MKKAKRKRSAAARPQDWERVARQCARLKRRLVNFAESPALETEWDRYRASCGAADVSTDELDAFLMEHRLDDGRTVIDVVLERSSDFSPGERALLAGWKDNVMGVFRITERRLDHVVADNLVDGLTYRLRTNLGRAGMVLFAGSGYLITRATPVHGDWMLSGIARTLPAGDKSENIARAFASAIARRTPRRFFRNPEHLRRAWAAQHEDRACFIERFGGPELFGAGAEMGRLYLAFHEERVAAAIAAARDDPRVSSITPPKVEFPKTLTGADDVGVLYDAAWGLGLYLGYGEFRAAFEDPARLEADPSLAETVEGFARSASVDPSPFLEMARRWPENMSRTISAALGLDDFDWSRDGERWLRALKAAHYRHGPLPTFLRLPDELVFEVNGKQLPLL